MLFKIHLARRYKAKRKGNTFSESLNGWATERDVSSLWNSCWIITLLLETLTDAQPLTGITIVYNLTDANLSYLLQILQCLCSLHKISIDLFCLWRGQTIKKKSEKTLFKTVYFLPWSNLGPIFHESILPLKGRFCQVFSSWCVYYGNINESTRNVILHLMQQINTSYRNWKSLVVLGLLLVHILYI